MSNRGYHRRRRRITGRFYAFVTVLVVLCVMGGVLLARRPSAPAYSTPPPVLTQPTDTQPAVIVTPAPEATYAPAPEGASVPAPESQTAPETPGTSGESEILDDIDPDIAPLEGDAMEKVTSLSVTQGLSPDWHNILLLGSDTRNIKKVSRTDTIMIAAVNSKDGRVKLVSIMRDLVVPIAKAKGGQGKINSVIHYGGPDLVMKTVNELFGMNITEYVMVNFASFQKVIDILGGVKIDVTKEEMDEINKSLGENAMVSGTMTQQEFMANKGSLMLTVYGKGTRLTGIQALGYARIRHVGAGDYVRTERQRAVLDAVLKGVQDKAGLIEIMQMATAMWGEFVTNIGMMDAVGIAGTVIKNGATSVDKGWRIPGTSTSFKSETRNKVSALWDCDFEANRQLLYKFIYES